MIAVTTRGFGGLHDPVNNASEERCDLTLMAVDNSSLGEQDSTTHFLLLPKWGLWNSPLPRGMAPSVEREDHVTLEENVPCRGPSIRRRIGIALCSSAVGQRPGTYFHG